TLHASRSPPSNTNTNSNTLTRALWLRAIRSGPAAEEHDEGGAKYDGGLEGQERPEVLHRCAVGEVVEHLDAHVVGDRVLGAVDLERIRQVLLEALDFAARQRLARVAERDLRQARDPRL